MADSQRVEVRGFPVTVGSGPIAGRASWSSIHRQVRETMGAASSIVRLNSRVLVSPFVCLCEVAMLLNRLLLPDQAFAFQRDFRENNCCIFVPAYELTRYLYVVCGSGEDDTMPFSAVNESSSVVKDRGRCCLLIASIVRREGEMICTAGAGVREQGSERARGGVRGRPLIHDKTVDEWGTAVLGYFMTCHLPLRRPKLRQRSTPWSYPFTYISSLFHQKLAVVECPPVTICVSKQRSRCNCTSFKSIFNVGKPEHKLAPSQSKPRPPRIGRHLLKNLYPKWVWRWIKIW